MSSVNLTFAAGPYDRIAGLADGRVRAQGVDLNVLQLEPEEIFWRMMRHAEFDVSEMSLSSYAIAVARGDDRFVGLPVFLSRTFRHSAFYLAPGSSISTPEELAGTRVGVPEYQMTAAVWQRGLLADEHGVAASDITWVTGGMEQAGRAERQPLSLPGDIRTERLTDRTLVEALLAGELSALMAPRVPRVYRQPSPPIRRLWDDYAAREEEYFTRTGLFPIMHLVVLRRDHHERHPWLAQELTKALYAAKSLALDGIADAPALRWALPTLLDAVERSMEVFGADPWPYGLEANRHALTVFCRYLREQGLIGRELGPDELFAPSTHVEARI